MAQEMTLQELLKNDEDKRSDQGGKSGERLVGWRQQEVRRPRRDMLIKAQVTSLNHRISRLERLVSGIKHKLITANQSPTKRLSAVCRSVCLHTAKCRC